MILILFAILQFTILTVAPINKISSQSNNHIQNSDLVDTNCNLLDDFDSQLDVGCCFPIGEIITDSKTTSNGNK